MLDDDAALLEEARESKFAHLLKPIRDLAVNFSVDIAHELEEYLDTLEATQFAFAGGDRPVDFAEAALLIQGSACIYSKKVEHLYNLVYQALEVVRTKRQVNASGLGGGDDDGAADGGEGTQTQHDKPSKGPSAAARRAAAAAAAEAEDSSDLEACFWDIEKHLTPGEDIDLPVIAADPAEAAGAGGGSAAAATAAAPQRVPATLLALEDVSCGGGGSGSNGPGDSDAGYRLQQCFMHCSGALMLDAKDGERYDSLLRPLTPPQQADQRRQQQQQQCQHQHQLQESGLYQEQHLSEVQHDASGDPMDAQAVADCSYPGASRNLGDAFPAAAAAAAAAAGAGRNGEMQGEEEEYDAADAGIGGGGHSDDPDDIAMGNAAAGADLSNLPTVLNPEQRGAARDRDELLAGGLGNASAAGAGGFGSPVFSEQRMRMAGGAAQGTANRVLRSGLAARPPGGLSGGRVLHGELHGEEDEEAYYDPYEPLDPDAKGNLPIKPLLVRKPSKAVTARRLAGGLHGHGGGGGYGAAPAPVPGLVHAEFAYGLALLQVSLPKGHPACTRQTAAQRDRAGGRADRNAVPVFDLSGAQAAALEDQSGLDLDGGGGSSRRAAATAAAAAGIDPAIAAVIGTQDPDNDSYQGLNDGFGGGSDDDDDDDGFGGGGGSGYDALDPDNLEGAVRMGGNGGCSSLQELAEQPDGGSYEDLCRAHMEQMMAAAAAQEVRSELAQRVGCWRSKMDPVLREEEARPGFDIHVYGESILTRLDALQGQAPSAPLQVNFDAVTRSLRKHEVSRLFAAMLQLINNRNVAILKSAGTPDQPFKLQLLSMHQAHKSMGESLAAGGAGSNGTQVSAAATAGGSSSNNGEVHAAASGVLGDGGGNAKRGKGDSQTQSKSAAYSASAKSAVQKASAAAHQQEQQPAGGPVGRSRNGLKKAKTVVESESGGEEDESSADEIDAFSDDEAEAEGPERSGGGRGKQKGAKQKGGGAKEGGRKGAPASMTGVRGPKRQKAVVGMS